jgi:PA14 domain-containing protein
MREKIMTRRLIALLIAMFIIGLSATNLNASSAYSFGSNWTAQFYSDTNFGTQTCSASGISGINFNWGTGAPSVGGCIASSSDNISIRFTSTQTFNAGTYRFVASSDDGIRAIIDGVTVLDRLIARPLTTDQFTMTLTAGSHSFEVDYVEFTGQAVVQFQWFLNSGSVSGGPGPVCPGPLDGRINNDPALDCAPPIAIYGGNGSIDIYAINPDTSVGVFVARVEIGPAPDSTDTLYKGNNPFTGQPILVSELPTGEIQVNTAYGDGKPYILLWPADDSSQLVHLAA